MNQKDVSLAVLQRWFHRALVFPQNADVGVTETRVAPSEGLTSGQRLGIYQRGYYLRILKCMQEQFPALCHALSLELFTDFARQYLEKYPPVSYTLYDLGRRFPGYLEETRPDKGEPEIWVDFMIDLAHYERQLFVLFDAPGHEGKPFAPKKAPDDLLVLQPCFALGDYSFPVAWYYHEVRKGADPALPGLERAPVALVRRDYVTHTYLLRPPHYTFLHALQDGKTISEALVAVAEETGRSLSEVHASWRGLDGIRSRWIEAGFFIEKG